MSELYTATREVRDPDQLRPAIAALAAKITREHHLDQIPSSYYVDVAPLVLGGQDPIDLAESRPVVLGGTHRNPHRLLPEATGSVPSAAVTPWNADGDAHRVFRGVYFGGPPLRATRLSLSGSPGAYIDVTKSGYTLQYPYERIHSADDVLVDETTAQANELLDTWDAQRRDRGELLAVVGPHITSYANYLMNDQLAAHYRLFNAIASAGEQGELVTPPLHLVEGVGEVATQHSGIAAGGVSGQGAVAARA